jgi:ParB family chromosome partitioning protein
VVAADVGTPTDAIPAQVVAKPGEADRITDQMVEKLHRLEHRQPRVHPIRSAITVDGIIG